MNLYFSDFMDLHDEKYGLGRAGPWVLEHTHHLSNSYFHLFYQSGCPRHYVPLSNSCLSATLSPRNSDVDKGSTYEPWEVMSVCICVMLDYDKKDKEGPKQVLNVGLVFNKKSKVIKNVSTKWVIINCMWQKIKKYDIIELLKPFRGNSQDGGVERPWDHLLSWAHQNYSYL